MPNIERPHEYSSLKSIDVNSEKIEGKLIRKILPDFKILNFKKSDYSPERINNRSDEIILYSFFSEWCLNCHYDADTLKKLFSIYNKKGLMMVLTMDYSHRNLSTSFIEKYGLNIPFTFGELDEKNEQKRNATQLYRLRKTLGDERDWGTPFHILMKNGSKNIVGIIMGEIIESELIPYLNEVLSTGWSISNKT